MQRGLAHGLKLQGDRLGASKGTWKNIMEVDLETYA